VEKIRVNQKRRSVRKQTSKKAIEEVGVRGEGNPGACPSQKTGGDTGKATLEGTFCAQEKQRGVIDNTLHLGGSPSKEEAKTKKNSGT